MQAVQLNQILPQIQTQKPEVSHTSSSEKESSFLKSLRESIRKNDDGTEEIRKICEFGINLDERIADGYYFAKSVRLLQYIFDNPELLEEDANKKIDLGENR